MKRSFQFLIAFVLLVSAVVALGVHWTVNRIYVPEGHSLLLRYRGPFFTHADPAPNGTFANEAAGEIGVFEEMRGPGRHFYCPLWWERELVEDLVVFPGQIAVITSKLGEPLDTGQFLVDFFDENGQKKNEGELGETIHKGVLRKALGPGRYRINPYGYEYKIVERQARKDGNQVKHSGWVEIPTGYVGVETYLTDNKELGKKTGVQSEVLPPGLYAVNPRERQVDIVEVGYREVSIVVRKQTRNQKIVFDESGEPLAIPETGISFPSNDGFKIQMDFTAVWGVMPNQAAQIVRTFGNVAAVEQKVILPQSESICRNNGSKMGAVELLVGDTRQQFQRDTSAQFQKVLKDKNVKLLYGLVRHIYIPRNVRIPIQNGYIADELKLTREQERDTAKTEANLRQEEKRVELKSEEVRVETEKMVASVLAEGERSAREISADTERQVAAVDRKVAELEAERDIVLGKANAGAEELQRKAKADKFRLAVKAFGSGGAYTKWQFAEGLPLDIDLNLFYAGEGTLWTDLKNVTPTIPLRARPKK